MKIFRLFDKLYNWLYRRNGFVVCVYDVIIRDVKLSLGKYSSASEDASNCREEGAGGVWGVCGGGGQDFTIYSAPYPPQLRYLW